MRLIRVIICVVGIFILLSPLSAQTWQNSKRLTWTSGASWDARVATDTSNNIHVVWDEYLSGNWEVFYKKSTNGGTSWTTKRLTWNTGTSFTQVIAVDTGGNIHVVLDDDSPGNVELFYKKSTNGGTSWTTKRLTWTSGDSSHPDIAIDTNAHIHVVWHDLTSGNDGIYYKKSTDGGLSWTRKRLTWGSGISIAPTIATDSNDNIHVVWNLALSGNWEIYYKKSTDGGSTWSTQRLTWSFGDSWESCIAIDSSNHVHIVWVDETPGISEIFYKKSTNGGSSWTTKRLTWNSAGSYTPAITTDSNGYIHVVWDGQAPGNNEIYYKRSTNGGAGWTTKRLTWNLGTSEYPAIAADSSSNIHVVWEDNTPGNDEIYYKKGIQ